MKFYVYELVNPINNKVFYVGKGTSSRAKLHQLNIKNGKPDVTNNTEKGRIIRSILDGGMDVRINIVYESDDEPSCYDVESELINSYGIYNLTNIQSSKNAGKLSELVKNGLNSSEINKNRLEYIKTDEYRMKCRENNLGPKNPCYGAKWNDTQRENITKANKKNKSQKHKNKISDSLKQYTKTEEHRKNISKGLNNSTKYKNVMNSDEYKRKQSKLSSGKNNANSKKFIFESPTGKIFEVHGGYYKFIEEHGLSKNQISKVRRGIISDYNGWKVTEIKKNTR